MGTATRDVALIDVKLMGLVHGVRTFAPLFIAQGSGHFLNTALGTNSAQLVPPGAATTNGGTMPEGAMKPAPVAEAAIEAVEAGRVHAIVGQGTATVVKQRMDGLLADLV